MHVNLQAPYRPGNLTRDQISFEKAMSVVRVTDE